MIAKKDQVLGNNNKKKKERENFATSVEKACFRRIGDFVEKDREGEERENEKNPSIERD